MRRAPADLAHSTTVDRMPIGRIRGGARRALTERGCRPPRHRVGDLPDTDLPQTQNGEGHADERQLVDDDQRRGVVRADQIAHVGSSDPVRPVVGAATSVYWRLRRAVSITASSASRSPERRRAGMLALVLFARDRAALKQGFQTRPIGLCVLQRRRVAGEDRLRLLQRRLEGSRIEAEQGSPLLDLVAFSEMDGSELAGGLRSNVHARDGLGRADGRNREGDRLALGPRRRDGTVAPAESFVASSRAEGGRSPGPRSEARSIPTVPWHPAQRHVERSVPPLFTSCTITRRAVASAAGFQIPS